MWCRFDWRSVGQTRLEGFIYFRTPFYPDSTPKVGPGMVEKALGGLELGFGAKQTVVCLVGGRFRHLSFEQSRGSLRPLSV